jgi:SRSO17 transposase
LGGIQAWVIDDTGFPKKGRDSVGVSRQYCGVLGKQDNCQVAVSISLANVHASLPAAWRLYLPEAWIKDADRRKKARVPDEVIFRKSGRSPWTRSIVSSHWACHRLRSSPMPATGW